MIVELDINFNFSWNELHIFTTWLLATRKRETKPWQLKWGFVKQIIPIWQNKVQSKPYFAVLQGHHNIQMNDEAECVKSFKTVKNQCVALKKKNRLKGWTQNLKLWESSFKQITFFFGRNCAMESGVTKDHPNRQPWYYHGMCILLLFWPPSPLLACSYSTNTLSAIRNHRSHFNHSLLIVVFLLFVCLFWKNTFISFGVTLVESQNVIHQPQSSPGQPCTFSFCCFFYLLLLTLLQSVVHEWD